MEEKKWKKIEQQKITKICNSVKHALFVEVTGYHVTKDGKIYQGWWDAIQPRSIEEFFDPWMKANAAGAVFIYIIKTFFGCDHTTYYVFEYEDGSYRYTSMCGGTT